MPQIVRPVRKRIGVIEYDGIMALDPVGPMEAFARGPTGDSLDGGVGGDKVIVLSLDKRPFTSQAGLVMHPHTCPGPSAAVTFASGPNKSSPMMDS